MVSLSGSSLSAWETMWSKLLSSAHDEVAVVFCEQQESLNEAIMNFKKPEAAPYFAIILRFE
jgi:hypothetical protein